LSTPVAIRPNRIEYAANTSRLLRCARITAKGTPFDRSAMYTTSAPMTPKIAPEAPALFTQGFQATLARLATIAATP
jgi:hypothetical protein